MQSNVQISPAKLTLPMKMRAHPSRLSSRQTRLPIRANTVKGSCEPCRPRPRGYSDRRSRQTQPFAQNKPRIVRDSKVAGLHVWIGKRKKTFRYQYEAPRVNGQRGATLIEWLGEHPHHSADEARAKALAIQAARVRGEPVRIVTEVKTPTELAFGQAWEHYKAAITKEGKSPRTIADYQDKFDRHLAGWHRRPLAAITREEVTRQHAAITESARKAREGKYACGKYAANGSMRFARAVWNYAKDELETPGLPERNPFRSGKLFHKERARNTGMGVADLPAWWAQLQQLANPIRRELHLFMLLSGCVAPTCSPRAGRISMQPAVAAPPLPKGGDRARIRTAALDRHAGLPGARQSGR